mgnify:CR=1 FL=1
MIAIAIGLNYLCQAILIGGAYLSMMTTPSGGYLHSYFIHFHFCGCCGRRSSLRKGTTIGYKRMLRFPAVKAGRLRVKIDECRLTAHINQVAAYYAPPLQATVQGEDWNNLPRTGWIIFTPISFISTFAVVAVGVVASNLI